jgi:sporulation protein YlmC with PRC-barrel domain
MLKKHMAACLVASAFMTMPVLAQTSTSPGAASPGATQPATTAPSGAAAGGAGAAAGGASGRFITQQQQNQWRASKLIGVNVYGADNERIGDVNEVLVDRQGNADAVVLGVGGFLGIGEKNVALPFNAFEWQMEDTRRTASASGTGAGGSGTAPRSGDTAGTTASTGSTAGSGGGAARDTAGTTASTSTAGSGSGSAARSSGADRGYPDHAVLRMTKADLQNAPTFRYVGDRASDDRSSSGAGTGGTGAGSPGTAPKQ